MLNPSQTRVALPVACPSLVHPVHPSAFFKPPTLLQRKHYCCGVLSTAQGRLAGPQDLPPSYDKIDGQPLSQALMALFKGKMVAAIGQDTESKGYDAIISLTRTLNTKYRSPAEVQTVTQQILRSLFPSWLPGAFKVMFSRPLPEVSCRLNAAVTALTCQWLMGPCQVNDVETPGGGVAQGQGVKVERCRYLEEAGCASVCINSCKKPTQAFFIEDMGLPLTMTPNYDDFSCQFSFGVMPTVAGELEALDTPCFAQCPTKKVQEEPQCHKIDANSIT